MIFIRLAGGLGNQLFQLAAGLEVQLKTQMPIVIYTEALKNYAVKREPALLSLIELSDKIQVCKTKSELKIKMLKYRLGLFNFPFCINNKTITKIPANKKFYLVDGYFQHIRFIKNGINQVKNMLNYKLKNGKVNWSFSNIIQFVNEQENTCALHIRRGDYTSSQNKSIYPLLGDEYYRKSIQKIGKTINKLVIFSDDISIAFDFFRDYEIIRVSDYDLTDYQEFQLMAMFKNIVIANSTFSFWSAICNSHLNKIKIAPPLWSFIEKEQIRWKNNLLLENFIVIENE